MTPILLKKLRKRIALGIKAYCANLKFFKSRLVTIIIIIIIMFLKG